MPGMTERSSNGTLRQRFSPHPMTMPRTAWQRANRAKTDSGWPLLIANFAYFTLLAAGMLTIAGSGVLRQSVVFYFLAYPSVVGMVRTGYVMICVAQGKTGQLAPVSPQTSDGRTPHARSGRHL